MEFSVIANTQKILNDPTVRELDLIRNAHETLKSNAFQFCDLLKHVYDPLQNVWNKWCEDNLTKEEKDYLIATYNGIQAMAVTSK